MSSNVYDISEELAMRTARHVLTLTEEGEAGLTARLSLFPDDHVKRVIFYAKQIKCLENNNLAH